MPPKISSKSESVMPLRIGFVGKYESGKTHAALRFAYHLADEQWEKVGVIMSEANNVALMKWVGEKIKVVNMITCFADESRYAPANFIASIQLLEKEGCTAIVIDSLSEVWSGKGGAYTNLEKVEAWKMQQAQGKINQEMAHLYEAIKDSPAHVITTLKAKKEATEVKKDKAQQDTEIDIKNSFLFILNAAFVLSNRMVIKVIKDKFSAFTSYQGEINDDFCRKVKRLWLEAKGQKNEVPKPEPVKAPVPITTQEVAQETAKPKELLTNGKGEAVAMPKKPDLKKLEDSLAKMTTLEQIYKFEEQYEKKAKELAFEAEFEQLTRNRSREIVSTLLESIVDIASLKEFYERQPWIATDSVLLPILKGKKESLSTRKKTNK